MPTRAESSWSAMGVEASRCDVGSCGVGHVTHDGNHGLEIALSRWDSA
jgi:hypothetical protein